MIGQNNERDWPDNEDQCVNNSHDGKPPKVAPCVRFEMDREVYDPRWCKLWSPQGRYMSSRETKESNRMLRVWLDATTIEDSEERKVATNAWLKEKFMDDCKKCQDFRSEEDSLRYHLGL